MVDREQTDCGLGRKIPSNTPVGRENRGCEWKGGDVSLHLQLCIPELPAPFLRVFVPPVPVPFTRCTCCVTKEDHVSEPFMQTLCKLYSILVYVICIDFAV
jgi:hypothetical protein